MAPYGSYEGEDTVEKRSVAIFPTGVIKELPEDGIHVVFGPEMQSEMGKVIEDKCGDSSKMDACQKELSNLLQDSDLRQHTKRFLGVIAAYTVAEILNGVIAAVVGALGGLAIGAGINAAVAPPSVNFEDLSDNGVLGQINDLAGESTIAIATGTDNKIMATLTITNTVATPTHAPEESLTVEEVTEDNGDDKKGDILIHIPEKTAQRALDYMGMWGLDHVKEACKGSAQTRRSPLRLSKRVPPTLSEECEQMLRDLSGATLEATNDVLQQLIPADPNNPMNPANHPEGAAVPNVGVNGVLTVVALVRQAFGNENLEPGRLDEFLMHAAIVTEIVLAAALNAQVIEQQILTIRLAAEWISRVFTKDVACKKDLICVEDNCKGFKQVGPVFPIFQGKKIFQTGVCTEKENKGCLCTEVEEPYVHTIEEGYFEALWEWRQELLKPGPQVNCDSGNKIDLDTKDFEDNIGSACQNHDELKRLKSRAPGMWDWSNVDQNSLQWAFNWNDQGGQCEMKCEEMFEIFEDDENCVWNGGMSKSGFIATDCGVASYSVDKPKPPECLPAEFGAPRGQKEVDHEGGQGTSVDDALEQFCNDIGGQKVDESNPVHARRWGFSEWGVPDRRSFWLKAEYINRPGCQGYEWPHKTNCKVVLKQSMGTCAGDQGRSTGFIVQGIGCIDYSLHVSDVNRDDSPPWKEPVKEFPPPVSAPKTGTRGPQEVVCAQGQEDHSLSEEDVNKLIGEVCIEGQPVNPEIPQPYDDMAWCNGFDHKLKKDDCTYALRRIHHTCSDGDKLYGGEYTYRCVHYVSMWRNGVIHHRA
ncbi:hypothetical protein K458DRAFT_352760 [Lentithecium fluviatile CBS 122367]|uniref:Uncharacterized protein n=1 Tax=Lentithecium fluviatile CBS 122367 TaxID=1168545 RepID=A0A6G1IC54_9PLEO|nr:hypothetical protein K458DRAFT_352760 [Lentithecium fluviatile CBS 122367]